MKSIQFISVLLVLMIACIPVYAQTSDPQEQPPATHHIEISGGLDFMIKLDEAYSRLRRTGSPSQFLLSYQYAYQEMIVETNLTFALGELKVSDDSFNSLTAYRGGLSVSFLHIIPPLSTETFRVYMGSDLRVRGGIWFPNDDVLRYGWDIHTGLGMDALVQYMISSDMSVEYKTDLFLAGMLWRPHINGQQLTTEEIQLESGLIATAFENPRFAHPFNSLYTTHSLRFLYQLIPSVGFLYSFNLAYAYTDAPVVKKGFDIANRLSIRFSF